MTVARYQNSAVGLLRDLVSDIGACTDGGCDDPIGSKATIQ